MHHPIPFPFNPQADATSLGNLNPTRNIFFLPLTHVWWERKRQKKVKVETETKKTIAYLYLPYIILVLNYGKSHERPTRAVAIFISVAPPDSLRIFECEWERFHKLVWDGQNSIFDISLETMSVNTPPEHRLTLQSQPTPTAPPCA